MIGDALIARQPDRHCQFALVRAFRREVGCFLEREAGLLQPLGHRLMGEAEARMGMLVAQIFEPVRCEIDDDEPAAGRKHTRSLGNRRLGLLQEMQHLMDRHEIESLPVERQVEDIAVADGSLRDPRPVEVGARDGKHVAAGIDADAAPVDALEKLQDTTGAGAEIEQAFDRFLADHRLQRGFDIAFADMEPSKFIPFGGIAAEIGLRLLGTLAFQHREPRRILGKDGVFGRGCCEQFAHQRDASSLLPQAEIGPCPFLIAIDERHFGKQLQMPGDTRLRLPENFGKIGHGKITGGQQGKQAHPRRLTRRLQHVDQRVQSKRSAAHYRLPINT